MIANIILYILFGLLFLGVAAVIIFDNGDSGTKMAWLLTITLLPLVGILLYLMCGINYRNHYFFQRRHKAAIDKFRAEYDPVIHSLLGSDPPFDAVREDFRPLAKLLANIGHKSQHGQLLRNHHQRLPKAGIADERHSRCQGVHPSGILPFRE